MSKKLSSITPSCSTQFEIAWSKDKRSIIYDYHRYILCQRQPSSLKTNEHQFTCYRKDCSCKIRVRKTDAGRWVVSQYVMHDIDKQQNHAFCYHQIHTSSTKHVDLIKHITKQDVMLSGETSRKALENQMLQNPTLNKLYSVTGKIWYKFLFYKKK